ncbi:MAG: class I SAM-dependent methyltransferase [Caulobacteraceae bacterium]
MPEDRDPREHWNAVYSKKDRTAVSWYEATPVRSLAWIAATSVTKDTPIIDVGGGPSPLAERLIDLGYRDVTVLDVSDEALRRLEGSAGVHTILADVARWRPQRTYGVWHDRALLHFLTSDAERDHYFAALTQAVVLGGHVLIATFAPNGPEQCSGLPVRRYGLRDLSSLLGPAFAVEGSEQFDHHTPSGSVQRFHVGKFRRVIAQALSHPSAPSPPP